MEGCQDLSWQQLGAAAAAQSAGINSRHFTSADQHREGKQRLLELVDREVYWN